MSRAGVFVAVVGPSGAGKDSLIGFAERALAGDRRFVFPRRVVTRPADGTEPHDSVDTIGFRRLAAAGGFALQWEAHGLSYGIPASVHAEIARGAVVVANLSRSVLAELGRRFPGAVVIEVSASPAVLAARLEARGREAPEMREARLRRAGDGRLAVEADATIVNDGALDEAGGRFVAALRRAAARPAMLDA